MSGPVLRKALPGLRWQSVEVLGYKPEGSAPFRGVTRQVLFHDEALACEWRYFEVAAAGWSTLERHEHVHAVMILRGRGRCLVGDAVLSVGERDLVRVPPMAWHQFRADDDSPLGFLCLVNRERDRPQLPDEKALAQLAGDPAVAAFIRR